MSSSQDKLNSGDALIVTKIQIIVSMVSLLVILVSILIGFITWKNNVDSNNMDQDNKIKEDRLAITELQRNNASMHDILIKMSFGQELILKKLHIEIDYK